MGEQLLLFDTFAEDISPFQCLKVKLKLYNTCVLRILLYGSECWAITKVDGCRLDALDQWKRPPDHLGSYG